MLANAWAIVVRVRLRTKAIACLLVHHTSSRYEPGSQPIRHRACAHSPRRGGGAWLYDLGKCIPSSFWGESSFGRGARVQGDTVAYCDPEAAFQHTKEHCLMGIRVSLSGLPSPSSPCPRKRLG